MGNDLQNSTAYNDSGARFGDHISPVFKSLSASMSSTEYILKSTLTYKELCNLDIATVKHHSVAKT